MKIIVLTLIFIPFFAFNQIWFPIGATWYYNYQEQLLFPANGYSKYSVIKDTVINSKLSKVISVCTIRYNGDTLYTDSLILREENSKVYTYEGNVFRLMYDFSLDIGDTLLIDINENNCDSVSPIILDSVKTININNIAFKVQYLKGIYYYNSTWGGQQETRVFTIIEKIGHDPFCPTCSGFIFNPDCNIGDIFVSNGLRCYYDNEILFKNTAWNSNSIWSWNANMPCDTLINGNTYILNYYKNTFNILSNPSTGLVSIASERVIKKIDIYDIMGNLLNTIEVNKNFFILDIHLYSKGLYLLVIKNIDSSLKFVKLLKI